MSCETLIQFPPAVLSRHIGTDFGRQCVNRNGYAMLGNPSRRMLLVASFRMYEYCPQEASEKEKSDVSFG